MSLVMWSHPDKTSNNGKRRALTGEEETRPPKFVENPQSVPQKMMNSNSFRTRFFHYQSKSSMSNPISWITNEFLGVKKERGEAIEKGEKEATEWSVKFQIFHKIFHLHFTTLERHNKMTNFFSSLDIANKVSERGWILSRQTQQKLLSSTIINHSYLCRKNVSCIK